MRQRASSTLDRSANAGRLPLPRVDAAPGLCPHCQQPMPQWRAGVRLSPLKARIFDAIKRAGADGIRIEDINAICFDGLSTNVNVRTHIHQINDALAETDIQIYGGGNTGLVGFFRIRKLKQKASL
jgi:hypothetical protein